MLFTEAQKAFEKYMIYHEMSQETIKGYMKDLRNFNRFITERYNSLVYVEDITLNHVKEYMYYLVDKRELAPRSRNRYLFSLRSFFNYAVKKQWVDRNVAAKVNPVKVMQEKKVALTQEEIEELLEVIEHPIIRFAVVLMANSGIQVIEAKGIKMIDIDLAQNQFLITGKGKWPRYVPIAKELKPYLEDYLTNIRGDIDSEYLLATTKTGRLSSGYINVELHKATEKLGWDKKVTCHTLRRSFATNLLRKGVNVFAISKLLGHQSLETTAMYLQLNENELQQAVDTL